MRGSVCGINKINFAERAMTAFAIQLNDNVNHRPRIIDGFMTPGTQLCLHAHKGYLFKRTASDFGRTLQSNGDGSDRGWGSHHFIMGGAVNCGHYYGVAPQIAINTPDQVGFGRLSPTISVDQYAATLASLFGVTPHELPTNAPNIGRFAGSNLGLS